VFFRAFGAFMPHTPSFQAKKRAVAKEPRSGGKTTAQGKRGRQAKAQPWVKHPPEHAAPAGRQKMPFP